MPFLRFREGCADRESAEAGTRILDAYYAKFRQVNAHLEVLLPPYAPAKIVEMVRQHMTQLGFLEETTDRGTWLKSRRGKTILINKLNCRKTSGNGTSAISTF